MARYTNSVPQILDGNGKPIVGAKKFFFEPGTTTKKTIYSDSALTVSTTNPQSAAIIKSFIIDNIIHIRSKINQIMKETEA